MRIQHPRATDEFNRGPPARVAVSTVAGSYDTLPVDDEGYILVDDEDADAAMDGLERAYGVVYDRDSGEIARELGIEDEGDETTLVESDAGDALLESDTDEDEDESDDEDELEGWASWNEDDWLSLKWSSRKSDVNNGLVDDHLEEIIEVETSENVREAAEDRLEELEE